MIISVFERVENIVGKGEIAYTSNFSFTPNVFKRLLSQTPSKGVIVCEWVNPLPEVKAFADNNFNLAQMVQFSLIA